MKKHSYRELNKRRFASHILFYLQDPADAKTVFEFSNLNPKETELIKRSQEVAETLISEYKKGVSVNLYKYSPYINQIKEALQNIVSKKVNQLQLL